jgi:hypothetical protein
MEMTIFLVFIRILTHNPNTYCSSLLFGLQTKQWAKHFGAVAVSEVITRQENPFEISDKKVEQIEQIGEKTQMNPINQKVTKEDEISTLNLMTKDGFDIKNLSEEFEFDDATEVEYDLDYTVQY